MTAPYREEAGPTAWTLEAAVVKAIKGRGVHAGDGEQAWETPWHIIRALERELGQPFGLDAACTPLNRKADAYYALPTGNGLLDPWVDVTYVNPPYADQEHWLKRAVWWARQGVRSVSLVLASTSALYWRPTCFECGTVDLFEGRIAFIDPATGLPVDQNAYSNALVWLGPGFSSRVIRSRSAVTGEIVSSFDYRHADLFAEPASSGGSK